MFGRHNCPLDLTVIPYMRPGPIAEPLIGRYRIEYAAENCCEQCVGKVCKRILDKYVWKVTYFNQFGMEYIYLVVVPRPPRTTPPSLPSPPPPTDDNPSVGWRTH